MDCLPLFFHAQVSFSFLFVCLLAFFLPIMESGCVSLWSTGRTAPAMNNPRTYMKDTETVRFNTSGRCILDSAAVVEAKGGGIDYGVEVQGRKTQKADQPTRLLQSLRFPACW